MELAIAFGVLIGVLIFALKASIGCGLASLSRSEVLLVSSAYFLTAIAMGLALDHIPVDMISNLLKAGLAMHAIIALALIALGIITIREWRCFCRDLSRRTFWALSMPCPACMAATFLSCGAVAEISGISPLKISLAVGMMLFITIFVISSLLRRYQLKPSVIGNIMLLIGGFYILSILLLPAYINMKSLPLEIPSDVQAGVLPSYLILLLLISIGFIIRKKGVTV